MAKLEIINLKKQFSSQVIPVKDITLEVNDGEFLTLLGPSGCGKSTLLRMIAGLDQPTEGKVILGHRDVTTLPPGQRNIAMVFQSYALYPHLTVFDNISTALKLRKIPISEIETRVNDVAHRLDIQHLLLRKPAQLSGGQRQRVALGRALVRNPEVFLLDEPLSNLDALLREQVRADLKQLFNSQQKPVVYVTHDQTEALTLSSKIAVLHQGYLQQLASPSEIYNAPANQFVAGFVGSPQMNLIRLNCRENYGILGEFQIPLPELKTQPSQIILGIRPEDIYLENREDSVNLEGKIFLVEDLGKEKLLNVRITQSHETIRFLVPAQQTWDGETIKLSLSPQRIHWFDSESGDRLS
ncbi:MULTISPECIES: ABC transporter ATP-binding protein [Planktothrix]|jgi:multiple sugar transport system ATP-binding protein|uniref:Sugar ABC transporter ATP-binding protein n=2 Tax=Planktothrix TaxID=54304 RepID=A0A4P5ZHU7_PLAAG|nr:MULTISPECIES: ABC transporter ATP-binding protein [Planktothrix]GDZ94704.1 sugar ABC transporter ATP-binding protein [Planktothrix agardhii CCAP 1459/11A]CAC5340421.1 Trehalose/maltose import ATP-binding protein MalK [Planktothrix rubescens NIVA-CYA 18]CAD5942344.1 putative ABC transporter ATP-binding protein YcjV [Planktothrix rubescens NIVA-CYA 18]CAH2572537.1 putative ABC transporter ATP-binding protein YcjV [Planktothrix rubescens]